MKLPAGIRAKLTRGSEQLKILYDEIGDAIDPNKASVGFKLETHYRRRPSGYTDGNIWAATTFIVDSLPSLSLECGIHLGEIVHNFRSALDHLAWAVVGPANRKGLTDRQLRDIEFPLAQSRARFKSTATRCLPGLTDKERAFFETYQPYKRSAIGRAMRLLQVLSNLDKHRVVLPTLALPERIEIPKVTYEDATLIAVEKNVRDGQQIKAGTKLLTLVLAFPLDGRNRQVGMNGSLGLWPAFSRSYIKPPKGFHFVGIDILSDVEHTCNAIVNSAEQRFFV